MSPAPEGPAGTRSVLIVDDTVDIRLLLRLALERAGAFSVVGEAADGRAAVALASELQPDAVLLDLAMPVMDGLQALPLLREASPGSCVVVLSGFNGRQLAGQALALGAHGYLEKGVRPAQLVAQLKVLCDGVVGPVREPESPTRAPPGNGSGTVQGGRMECRQSPEDLLDWLALLSHELTTPLMAIGGFASLLEDGWTTMTPDMVQRSLAGIGRSARHMQTVLFNFSSACEVDLEALELLLEDIDVAQLVAETVADLAGATSATRVLLVAPGPVRARIDKTRVRQVVTNLVSNATKFAGPDTDVAVEVDADAWGVRISVIDRGPGIPPDRQPELFQKFSRAGATAPGHGLGLYVSKAIALAHGGDITVHSDEGRGARFDVRLPRRAPTPNAVPSF